MPAVPGCLRWLPWIALAFVPASGGAAPSTCAEYEAMGQALAQSRDSDPAAGIEKGTAALAGARALVPACPGGIAMVLGGIATNLHMLGRSTEALAHYDEALETLGEGGTPTQRAFLHRGIGVVQVELEDFESALRHYLVALGISDAAGEGIESAKTAANIGIVYTSLGDFPKARDYYQRALAAFEAADWKPGIAGALVNLGAVAAKVGQQALDAGDAAAARREHQALKDYNERAEALFQELGNHRGVAYAASNIGLALDRLGQPELALAEHQRSLALRREVGDVFGTINSLLSLAATQRTLGHYEAAQAALDEAGKLVQPEAMNLLKDIAHQRVLLAEARGDYRAALAAERDASAMAAQIADKDQLARITALQDRFDADKAARQIDLLRSEAQVGELTIQRQRLATRLSVLIAVLAVGLLLVLLSRVRVGQRSTRKLAVAARTDYLTGLPNRRHLFELMEGEVARVARGGPPFCVLMADLDDFKRINDQHGHEIGDAVLCEVARRLREAVRRQDVVARWGGEEFLLLLPDTTEAGALALANALRERIASEPVAFAEDAEPVSLSLTMGFCVCRAGIALDDCIRAADAALYEGKRAGKNRVVAMEAAAAG
jgi:diguanylate cyclase (GGDEF)-like protein